MKSDKLIRLAVVAAIAERFFLSRGADGQGSERASRDRAVRRRVGRPAGADRPPVRPHGSAGAGGNYVAGGTGFEPGFTESDGVFGRSACPSWG